MTGLSWLQRSRDVGVHYDWGRRQPPEVGQRGYWVTVADPLGGTGAWAASQVPQTQGSLAVFKFHSLREHSPATCVSVGEMNSPICCFY